MKSLRLGLEKSLVCIAGIVMYDAGNGLRTLPDSVGQMTRLQSLECAANKLTKLPQSIGELCQLTVLDVSGNNLTVLPDSVGQLGKLEHLRASGNKLATVQLHRRSVRHFERCQFASNSIEH